MAELLEGATGYLKLYHFNFSVADDYIAASHYTGKKVFVIVQPQTEEERSLPTVGGVSFELQEFKEAIYYDHNFWGKGPREEVRDSFYVHKKGTLTRMGWRAGNDAALRHLALIRVMAEIGPDGTRWALKDTGNLQSVALEDLDWFEEEYLTSDDYKDRYKLISHLKERCRVAMADHEEIRNLLDSVERVSRFYEIVPYFEG